MVNADEEVVDAVACADPARFTATRARARGLPCHQPSSTGHARPRAGPPEEAGLSRSRAPTLDRRVEPGNDNRDAVRRKRFCNQTSRIGHAWVEAGDNG